MCWVLACMVVNQNGVVEHFIENRMTVEVFFYVYEYLPFMRKLTSVMLWHVSDCGDSQYSKWQATGLRVHRV